MSTNPFTEEHELLRQSITKFCEKEIIPNVEEWEALFKSVNVGLDIIPPSTNRWGRSFQLLDGGDSNFDAIEQYRTIGGFFTEEDKAMLWTSENVYAQIGEFTAFHEDISVGMGLYVRCIKD